MRSAVYKGYTVYSNGLIKKQRGEGYIQADGPNGYKQFGLRGGGRAYVHRFVWEAFNGEIPEGMVVDHIDNNPANNRLDNLQLLSRDANLSKAHQIFTKKQLDEIRYLREDLRWTLVDIAKRFNTHRGTIEYLEQQNYRYIY